jgi:UDP-2,4-diacetamido-2,4,6-trideoxy-beta-L-altropyranose hydrolase
MAETIIVRADATGEIGWGHLMRCLALAQAWQDLGGEAVFASAMRSPGTEARLQSEGMKTVFFPVEPGGAEDAARTIGLAREIGARWIVADGYRFGPDYQRVVKDAGLKLLFVDDNGDAAYYCADLILNQNLHAHADLYENRDAGTQLLLGTRYALLRGEFLKWRGWKREFPEVARRILITMGGGDSASVTSTIIETLQHITVDGLEAVVAMGAINFHDEQLAAAVRNSPVQIRLAEAPANMSELMAWADVAVSGAGSTCWEMAFMGLPGIVLVLAENQNHVARQLDSAGAAVSLGRFSDVSHSAIAEGVTRLLLNKELRVQMSNRCQDLIDGKGAVRVITMMRRAKLKLRRARDGDCRMLWEWASDASVRAAAFSSAPIPWEDHVKWFARKLCDPNCFIFIGLDNENLPIGQVRFDMQSQHEAEIDVSINKSSRGAGYGSLLIDMAVKELFEITRVQFVHAFIKLDNSGSISAFRKANFKHSGSKTVGGVAAGHYTRARTSNKEISKWG